ncbi:uncharacterized protein LOC118404086 [Branchiostoma floridae]|uniref:Uncharacterized protein LOC118404086 n=1 Tax=Branchiostoma floridae TaxID=7739 RepID=A0A9J7KED8_BRAFL|nr:uncharacterized protein LOC118404086 [Branchiostoma floridae]
MSRAGDRVCQRWDSQSPHSHPHTPQAHPDAGLEENFCRNPDNKERPWCYTTDVHPIYRWAYCDVMECADPTSVNVNVEPCTRNIFRSTLTSCDGMCGTRHLRVESCNCDKNCRVFGDCCKDFEERCSDIAQMTPDHPDKKWKCVPDFYQGTSYWLVADCPDDWTDDVTRQQCLKQVDLFNPSELADRMPVKNVRTTVSYRNIFCAFCNNVSLSEVEPWESTVRCTGLINSSTHHTTPSTQLYHTIVDNHTECLGISNLEFLDQYGKQCLYHEFDSSNVNCDESSCRSYKLFMRGLYKSYKNVHCALCEGLSPAASTKLIPCPFATSNVHGCFPNCISLTNLFNFGDDNDEDNPTHCPPNSVYDPFVDTCRLLKDDHTSQGSANKSVTFQNCSTPALLFTSEEFQALPNGSVHLLSANVTCAAEQVAIQNTAALVCGECILQYFSNDTRGGTTDNPWEADQGYLTLGLVVVSAVAAVAFVVYSRRPEQWKKMGGKLKVQVVLCMTTAESLFVGRVLIPEGPACTGFAILLHYLLLSAFTSMNALSLDLFLTFRQESERASLRKYILYTWLVPVLVVGLTAFVDFCPCSDVRVGYGQQACWIGSPTGSLIVFGAPVLCALLINLGLIIHTLLAIRKSFHIADAALVRSNSSKAWVYLRISFMTGFTWIIGFIVPYAHSRALEYIFIVLNASQGLLLTLLLTLTSDVVLTWMSKFRERFRPGKPGQDAGRPTTTAAGNQQSSVRGTETTATGTDPAVDIPMTVLVCKTDATAPEANPATGIPKMGRILVSKSEATAPETDLATCIHKMGRILVRKTEAKAPETNPSTDIPMTDLVGKTEATAPETNPSTDIPMADLVGKTEATAPETNPSTDIPMADLVGKTEATAPETNPTTDIPMTDLVGKTEATAPETNPSTDIPMADLVGKTEATAPETNPSTDIPMADLVGKTEATAPETNTATDVPMTDLVGKTEATAPETNPSTDIPMTDLVGKTEATAPETNTATDIPMADLVGKTEATAPETNPSTDIPMTDLVGKTEATAPETNTAN